MQLPVHTFLKLSKLHLQTGTDASNSIAGKYRCLTNQDNVTLDPCMSIITETISFFPAGATS